MRSTESAPSAAAPVQQQKFRHPQAAESPRSAPCNTLKRGATAQQAHQLKYSELSTGKSVGVAARLKWYSSAPPASLSVPRIFQVE